MIERWTTDDIERNLGWTRAQVSAAASLGLSEPRMCLRNDGVFTLQRRQMVWVRDPGHVKEWAATAAALMPRKLPRSFAALAAGSAVPFATVLRELGWTVEQLNQAEAIRFPHGHMRRVLGDDGIERVMKHFFPHDLDAWCDQVRAFIGHAVESSAGPPAA